MTGLPTRTRARVLIIFTVLALVFTSAGAAPGQERGEPTEEPGAITNLQTINDDLWVTGKLGSGGNLGVHTTNPIEDIDVISLLPGILLRTDLETIDPTYFNWHLLTSQYWFGIYNSNHPATGFNGAGIFEIDRFAPVGALALGNGYNTMTQDLGIGSTTPPSERIHIVNDGVAGFRVENTAQSTAWRFANNSNGDFIMTLDGSGGSEMVILKDGRVRMGPGAAVNFNLTPGGDLLIPNGDVIAKGVQLTSDVNAKTGFEPVNNQGVLDSLTAMDISTWSFNDEPGVMHLGPTAQDFAAAFELGANTTTINALDAQGVALAAIQALAEQNQQLSQENQELQATMAELKDSLDEVLVRLATLEEATN